MGKEEEMMKKEGEDRAGETSGMKMNTPLVLGEGREEALNDGELAGI